MRSRKINENCLSLFFDRIIKCLISKKQLNFVSNPGDTSFWNVYQFSERNSRIWNWRGFPEVTGTRKNSIFNLNLVSPRISRKNFLYALEFNMIQCRKCWIFHPEKTFLEFHEKNGRFSHRNQFFIAQDRMIIWNFHIWVWLLKNRFS